MSSRRPVGASRAKKKALDPTPALAREAEIAELIRHFLAVGKPDVASFEVALRAAVFRQTRALLGWEPGCTAGLAQIICRAGSRESSYQGAEVSLEEIGGMAVSDRQIQRLVQHIGPGAAISKPHDRFRC